MKTKPLFLLSLMAIFSSYTTTAKPLERSFNTVDEKRTAVELNGVVTHGYIPDSPVYFASNVTEDDDGKQQIQGATYRGEPEFDWWVADGFYAFCDNNKIKMGVTDSAMDFYDFFDIDAKFLFTLDNGSRYFYQPEIAENKHLYSPDIGYRQLFFQPAASFITALKQAKTVRVNIEAEYQLRPDTLDFESRLPMYGFAEMITRVMNHCPETAPEQDLTSLSQSQRLVTKAQNLLNTQNYDDAAKLLKQASKMGDGEASYLLGEYYVQHTEGDERWAKADKAMALGVKQGSAEAMCYVGINLIRARKENAENGAKGLALLEKAHAKQATCAAQNLGYMYSAGLLVEKDQQKAREYFKPIAKLEPKALHLLVATYVRAPQELDAEAYPWVQLMIENHDSDLGLKATICQRSPNVCNQGSML